MRQGVVRGWAAAAVCALGVSVGAQTAATPANPQTPAPAGGVPAAPQPSAKELFPFPEADSKGKQPDAVPEAPGGAPAGGTAQPRTPGGGYSSSRDGAPMTEPTAEGAHPVELKDAGSEGRVDRARAEKDMQVADFYIKDGNYMGAYLRYKDAVAFAPDDAEAHFGLAEMARKRGRKAEAAEEYAACVKLDARGRRAKEARKALEELQAASSGAK